MSEAKKIEIKVMATMSFNEIKKENKFFFFLKRFFKGFPPRLSHPKILHCKIKQKFFREINFGREISSRVLNITDMIKFSVARNKFSFLNCESIGAFASEEVGRWRK